jgi:hypothetical protein
MEEKFPWCQIAMLFDNSSNHLRKAPDALNANAMNVGPGGKKPKMRSTWGQNIQRQSMVFEVGDTQVGESQPLREGDELVGQPKGLKQVLHERGLFVPGMKKTHKDPNLSMVSVLSEQPDFRNAKTLIEDLLDSHGIWVRYLPRFHCE